MSARLGPGFLVFVATVCSLGAVACGGEDPAQPKAASAPQSDTGKTQPRSGTHESDGAPAPVAKLDVPETAVATIFGRSVPKAQFRRFIRAECLKRELIYPEVADRNTKETSSLPCSHQYDEAKATVMGFLIRVRWYVREARLRGIHLDPGAPERALANAGKTPFLGRELSLREWHERTGIRKSDLLFALRGVLLHGFGGARFQARGTNSPSASVMEARYRRHTVCAEGYLVDECSSRRLQ